MKGILGECENILSENENVQTFWYMKEKFTK
jgi:hypothetical protein